MSRRQRPTVNTRPEADRHAGPDERVVSIFSPRHKTGALVSFRETTDPYTGRPIFVVEVYAADPGVVVRVNGQDHQAPR